MASPLVVNILELIRRPGTYKDLDVDVSTAEFAFDDPRIDDSRDVHAELHVESTSGGIVVNGLVIAQARGACSRCLADLGLSVASDVDEIYQRVPENDDVYPLEGDQLDLRPMVRESVLLAIPEAPLCSPSCKGLCPVCGVDLNRESCGCARPTADDRWSVLDQLRGKLPE
jgi:uncharacterized protein